MKCRIYKDKKAILRRLNTANYALKRSLDLLEKDSPVVEILRQTKKAEDDLKYISSMILSNHINHCVIPVNKQRNFKEFTRLFLESFRLARKYDLTIFSS